MIFLINILIWIAIALSMDTFSLALSLGTMNLSYKKALFYKDIIRFSSVDKYSTDNYFKIDRNSKSTELLFHQEDGKWVYEEIID